MPEGLVVRGQGGLYYVSLMGEIVQCSARRNIKKDIGHLLVGDLVVVNRLPDGEGIVESILPRKNRLIRPAVANVDRVLTVFALRNPDPMPLFMDKLLIAVSVEGLDPVVVFTKCDLAPEEASRLSAVYRLAGYEVHVTSSFTGIGVDALRASLVGRVSVLAGPSGAGKSALMNGLQTDLVLKTGTVSEKIGRGRHTTRHASLLPLNGGGWVADTPGFSVLDLTAVKKERLQFHFPEFTQFLGRCRFNGCMHRAEPDCALKAAVANEGVDPVRYESYLSLLAEIEALPPEWARKSEE